MFACFKRIDSLLKNDKARIANCNQKVTKADHLHVRHAPHKIFVLSLYYNRSGTGQVYFPAIIAIQTKHACKRKS